MDQTELVGYIIAAILAVWTFYNSKYWPAREKRQEANTAFIQKAQSDALTQVLDMNRALTENLIVRSNVDGKLDAVETSILAKLETVSREVADVKRSLAVVTTRDQMDAKDRERMDEIISDVDMMFHEIKAMLTARLG